MASQLARIHGTEEDKVNCPFYFKIGACRHGDRCSRIHHKPAFSPTLLLPHLYKHPKRTAELEQQAGLNPNATFDEKKAQEDFLCFFEDMYMELSKYGRIDQLHIADNLGDHLIGHVYVKFSDEEEASDCLEALQGRTYDRRYILAEFSPVTEFRESRCREYDEGTCTRSGLCNFLHVKPVPMCLIRSLEEDADRERYERRQERKRQKRERRGH